MIWKDFEFAIYCSPSQKDISGLNFFWMASVPEHFPPRKSHCAAFELLIRKVEWFSLLLNLPIKNPSKQPGASSQRKLQSHSFRTIKMRSSIYTCQPEIILLIASFWLDVIIKQWLNNNRLKQTKCVFLNSYCLTTSNQKEATSRMISGWQV